MKITVEAAVGMLRDGVGFVQATILSNSGSTPRAAGAHMLVRRDGSIIGTVGGGVLEANIRRTAGQVMETGVPVVAQYALEQQGEDAIGAICGGRAKVLIEYICPENSGNRAYFERLLEAVTSEKRAHIAVLIAHSGALHPRNECLIDQDGSAVCAEMFDGDTCNRLRTLHSGADRCVELERHTVYLYPVGSGGTVYIFGAGHCGQKLAPILQTVGFSAVVVDDRAEYATRARFPSADALLVPDKMDGAFDSLVFGPDSYIVIVTRGHVLDERVLRRALRTNAGYVGMIGSRTKRETIYAHMRDDGYTSEDIARVHSPIGITIGAESPEEIAISIAAELIRVRAEKKNG